MDAVAHADAIAHVAGENQARILLLESLDGSETLAAVAPVLGNGVFVAEDAQQVGLHVGRILEHRVESL